MASHMDEFVGKEVLAVHRGRSRTSLNPYWDRTLTSLGRRGNMPEASQGKGAFLLRFVLLLAMFPI